jgi:glycosyltransferase involved in cell wall biosynthesis
VNPTNAKSRRFMHLITSLGGGGTENFLFQILSRSPEQYSHRVFYLGYDGVNGNRIRHLGIPVERSSPWQFYSTLRREKPDVLHTCLHWAHQVGRITGRIAKVPFILSSHRSIDVWQRPWDRDLDRRTLPLCTAIAVNSDAAQRVLEERLKKAKRRPRIVKVENGLDFEALKNWNRREARQNFGIPDGAVVGGTLMRLHPEKGAEKIPAFAKALLERYPQLILMVAGNGPLDRQLKEQTKVWGDRVRWVGWQEDPVEFLSSLDFFWLLSREESFPQALLESSAVGLPWVAPDVGGVRNFRDAGACGFIYSPQDPNGAVSTIGAVLANLPAYEAKAHQAVAQLKTRFDLSRMVSAFYNIVESRGR